MASIIPSSEETLIRSILSSYSSIAAAYLFGSVAQGTARKDSDIDIALLLTATTAFSSDERLRLQARLEDHLHRDVDLVILNDASPILIHQVFKTGKRLITHNSTIVSHFMIRAITDYADLKHVRAPIEQQILKGRQYARSRYLLGKNP